MCLLQLWPALPPLTRRASFAQGPLKPRLTPCHSCGAAGDYVLGKKDCSGLKVYTAEDKKVSGADPVLWYTFGVTHVIRPEDFPIMNVEVHAGLPCDGRGKQGGRQWRVGMLFGLVRHLSRCECGCGSGAAW
eukprot:365716-Chlamydomonas_euryale.AAC.4